MHNLVLTINKMCEMKMKIIVQIGLRLDKQTDIENRHRKH